MFSDYAIVDPDLTDNLPPTITAQSGIDALVQSIEAYWSINHNPISDKYALESIKLIINNLEKSVNNPTKTSRENMALGSLYGGLAFSNTQTTICHAISYPITANWNIPHGQAVCITLPIFMDIFIPLMKISRKIKILNALGLMHNNKPDQQIQSLIKNIGLKTKLSELGVPRIGINIILNDSFSNSRINNTPIPISKNDLKNILLAVF
jgi:alcohol dehydrogenase class IV